MTERKKRMTAVQLRDAIEDFTRALERKAFPGVTHKDRFERGMAAGYEMALDALHAWTDGEFGVECERHHNADEAGEA